MITSYHNHSCWSDGRNTIREMALAARDAGITEFGISDHLVLGPQPFGEPRFWALPPTLLGEYFRAAAAVREELDSPEFRVRIGIEADYFGSSVDLLAKMADSYDFDYVIGAAHMINGFSVDGRADWWQLLPPGSEEKIWKDYLAKVRCIAASGIFSFIAHLDLPKKFGHFMPESLEEEMEETLQAVKKSGIPIEVNTAGMDKQCGEWYPAPELLRRAVKMEIPLLVNADAHEVESVKRYFDEARSTLAGLGVRQVCSFEKRKLKMVPLD
jgi:histidinol-phosphatase (PHP family)